jgi:hypothetical protein
MRVSYKKQELFTIREHLSSPTFNGEVRPVHCVRFFLALSNYVSLRSDFRVVMFITISAKTDVRFVFTSSCL